MLRLCFLSVLLIQAQAALKCDEEIKTELIEDLDQIIGNWTYVFHWDNLEDDKGEKYPLAHSNCAQIEISEASKEYVDIKKDSCDADEDFDWENAKYKLISEDLMITNSIISVGENSAIMETCGIIASLEVRKMSDDYIMMINREFGNMVELLSKKTPSREDLECIVDNLDVGKDLGGVAYCFE